MSEVRVTAHLNGVETDITEGVKCLYDLVMSSMDWGSGFFTLDDALPVGDVARACGFPNIDEVDRYLAQRAEHEQWKRETLESRERQREADRLRLGTAAHEPAKWDLAFTGEVTNDHGHAFEQNGTKCVWPGCTLIRIPKGESDDAG